MRINLNKDNGGFIKLGDKLPVNPLQKYAVKCTIHGDVTSYYPHKCDKCISDQEKEFEQKQAKLELAKKIKQKQKEFGIEVLYADASFTSIEPINEQHRNFISICKDYADKVVNNYATNLILLGNVGTGKTAMSHAIMTDVIARADKSVRYVQFMSLNHLYFKEYNTYKKFYTAGLLVIDDIGIDANDYSQSKFFDLINARRMKRLPTIIITNLSPEQLIEMIGAATYSRLQQNSIGFVCDWEDLRFRKENKQCN